MTDQVHVPLLTPQELLARSNPAMYSLEREHTRDLTNPREMYSLLANNTKTTEDFTAKFKQEIAQSIQSAGGFPKLSRATSLNEIRRIQYEKSDRLGKFQSTADILNSGKKLNVLVLTHNRTSLEDFRTIAEDDKKNLNAVNLPNIAQNVVSLGDKGIKSKNKETVRADALPTLPAEQNIDFKTDSNTNFDIVRNGVTKSKNVNFSKVITSSDTKLEKWFSEMPNEVFDKAQRAIMEASIKEKLTKYQHKRNRKENFPSHVNVLHGSRLRKVPNTFLEVRIDSFGKHLKGEDRMNKYRLQQKSMHRLKMRELEEIERQERTGHEDIELTPRLKLQFRSHTTMTSKNKTDMAREKEKHEEFTNPVENCLKTFDINEALKRDILTRERTHINNYQDYAGRHHLSKSAHEIVFSKVEKESENDSIPKRASPIGIISNNCDSGIAKTTVVNIALETGTSIPPKKFHAEELAHFNIEKETEKLSEENIELVDTTHINDGENKDKSEIQCAERSDEAEENKCIAKIPTARSSRTSDSNKSTISSKHSPKPNKSVLSKFNKLEVFAENSKGLESNIPRQSYHGHKRRDQHAAGNPVSAPYKLDLKKYPQHFKNPVSEYVEPNTSEVRKQDLIFHFEPGEVFVSRKSHPNTYRTSERARIIYGKILNKEERTSGEKTFDAKLAKDSSSVHSMSTRLEGFKLELGDFENRAHADSTHSDSAREHLNTHLDNEMDCTNEPDQDTTSTLTKTPLEKYNKYGKVVREIAVETDLLGSDTGSLLDEIDGLGDKEPKPALRPESNLSDYIVDNNDGDSLNSDSEIDELVRDSTIRKSRSTQKSRATQSYISSKE